MLLRRAARGELVEPQGHDSTHFPLAAAIPSNSHGLSRNLFQLVIVYTFAVRVR